MEKYNRLIKQFNITDDELLQPPFYELLCVYNLMADTRFFATGLEILENEDIVGILSCDEYNDTLYMFEQIIDDYDNAFPNINQIELENRFNNLFNAIRAIKMRAYDEYYRYCFSFESDLTLEEISCMEFPTSNNNNETYKEINRLVKKYTNESRREYALEQCKKSFLELLDESSFGLSDNTRGFISRKTIDEKVKYKQLVYRFLKPKYVLDLKGVYLDIRLLKITEEVKNYMFEDLEYELLNNEIIHVDDIFNTFKETYFEEFRTYHIFTSYALFSLLEYLFNEQYEFKRPYITLKGKKVYTKNEMIENYLNENLSIRIEDFNNYLSRLKLSNAGFFNILDSMINVVCLENEKSIIHWKMIDIDREQIDLIEELIYWEIALEKTMAITDLQCAFYFPKLNIDWDEWFIYSLIKKYSNRIIAVPSSRQFRYSTPVITIEKEIDDFELNYINEYRSNKKIYKPGSIELDDIELEDIEELLDMEV